MRVAARFKDARRGVRASLLLMLALAAGIGPAAAQKVGVAAAVNPDAFTNRGGQLNIGKSIFYDERISTTGSGLVQVLLVDGSTFTVGPGSNLVIDKFVYNPKKQTGEMVATFSKGAMRYVGGKISKNEDGVVIKTPNGSLAVRGGMVQGIVSGHQILFSFLFGKEMVFTGTNGKTYTVFQPGYTLDLSGGVAKVRPTTPEDIAKVMALLTNSDTSAIGMTDQQGEGPDAISLLADVTNNIADLIDEATANRIQAQLEAQLRNLPQQQQQQTPAADDVPAIPDNLYGYAATTLFPVSDPYYFANTLVSFSPEDFAIFFNSTTQSGQASIFVQDAANQDPSVAGYRFTTPIGPINGYTPGHFGSFGTTVYTKSPPNQLGPPFPIASSTGAFTVNNPGPANNSGAQICARCDFMRWGVVGATASYGFVSYAQTTDYQVGFWVAGDIPTVGQLPSTGTASYSGTTWGMVASRDDNGPWDQPRPATGSVDMTWNFPARQGVLNIRNFDAGGPRGPINLSGTMALDGASGAMNRFHGTLGGSVLGNVDAGAYGSFARRGSDPAAGVLGNWYAFENHYRTTGVFGAARN